MIFKQLPTAISDLNKLGIALKSLDTMNIGAVGVNTANLESYRTALKGLNVEQSVFALASKGATEEQIRQILVTNQATASEVEAAMAKAGLTTATKALTQAEMVEMATKNGVAKAEAEALLSKIGISATEEGQVVVKKQVTLAMLEQAVASGTLTKAEASQIATMLGLNAAETANIGITNVLTASFTKLWAVITAHPIGAILTAVGAVAVGTIAYINKVNKDAEKAIVEAHENAEKALEDTKTSLSDDKSELQSINSELEQTKDKIKEISSIGAPTLTEQNELTKLSTANTQLETQKKLLENNIKLKQKSAALDAKELLGTQVEMEYSSILDNSSITSKKESYTYADHAKYQASNLKNAYNIYMKALEEGNVKRQELAQELIDASSGDTAELTSKLLEIVESFKYDDGTIIDGYEDIYNEYMGMIYNLQSLTNPDTFLDIAKSITVGTGVDYEKAISEAYALAYEGNFDVDNLNQDFVKALVDAGIDKSTIDYIFSLKQKEYQVLIDKVNQKYNPDAVLTPTYLESPDHVDTPEQAKQKEADKLKYEEQKQEVKEINDTLTTYAKENPIEFQLITSYDENFSTLDKYIEEEKSKIQSTKTELESLSKEGNVDLTIRPVIDSSAMQAAGWDVEDGSIATTFTQGEFIWQGDEENGQYVYVHYTPILPDGTVLTPDQLSDYLYGTLESSKNILEADDKGIVLKVNTDLQGVSEEDIKNLQENGIQTSRMKSFLDNMGKWDDSVHTVQESYYNMSGTIDYVDTAINRLVEDAKKSEGIITDETDISSTFTTFKSLWKSIGKGDDDASKAAKSAKEEILKLAEAGKLTEKEFEKSSIADTFIKAGYSIEEATNKINKMVDSSKQLSSLKSSISSIQDAYQEKKDNKVASSSTLSGMEDTFGKLSSWEEYKTILGSTSSTLEECKVAQNELATEFVYSNNFLSQLTSKNKEYYASQLKELGIANAQSIVEDTLKAKKQALANETKALEAATSDLSSETSNASEKFLEQANMTDLARVELVNLIAQQKIFEGQGIDTTAKVEQLNKLAEAYFGVANAIQISTAMGNDPRYYKNPEDYTKAIEEEWNKLINDQTKISIDPVKVSPKNDTKDKSSKSKSKSKSSDTKQEIDWLSRRLSRMQSIIDLTASKLKNLFKIDEKENNINKQIKQTTKLINQYGHAYDVYMSKANKVAKASGKGKNKVSALSKDIINKIQSGEITKDSYDKLIKKYGKDYADKINEYIDYYDKAQDSLKNKEEQIANKHQLKKDKIQLRIDNAQSKIDRADARIENATSASEKNKILQNEKKYYKELYKQKIEQAELDEDSVEVERLKAEQKKQERDLSIEQHQNNIDEKQSALDILEAQKENVTSASEKNAIIDQELALKREICNEELAIAELNGDQNEQERLKKQLLFEEKKAQLEQIANTKDEYDLKKNALSRDEAKLQQQIAENEAKGVGQSVKDYRKQIALSEERQKQLRGEKEYWEAQLAEQLASGKIVANESDAAYKELKDNIASCDEGISQCTVDQINWNKAIKEIDYKNYETLLDLLDMAYKKLENLRSIREAHGKELTNDEILKQIEIDDKIINSSKTAMESAKKNLSDAFKEGEYGFTLNSEQIDEFMDYLEYMPEQIPDLMKEFGIENFNKETYKGAFDEINKFTTANDSWVQALVDAEGRSDEIGQKIINHANEYLEALKKQKDYKDRIFAIEKAQYDLEKAKNNLTKKVWDGQQWVYTADTEAVQSAQESLDNAKFEEFNNSIQDLIEVLEKFIKDFNIYDDNGNMINNPDVILKKGVLGEYTIADIDKIFTDKVLDTSKLSGLMSNIQYAIPNVSIPNINLPEIQSRAMNQTVNYDKIELVLPNITDASTGADLARSFVNELKNLPSYAKQYDWNR